MATLKTPDAHGSEYSQAILETMQQPLLVLSPKLLVLRANRAFCRTFHMEPEQILNHPLHGLGHGQWDGPQLAELLGRTFSKGDALQAFEVTAELGPLGRRTLLVDARQLCVDGEPQGVLVTMEDITERKRVELALAASEVRYRRLFETAQDGILLVDAHTGEVVDANPFLERMLGFAHDEVVGKRLWDIGPFSDAPAASAAFERLQQDRYIRYEDLPLQTRDGSKIHVEFISNVYSVDGDDIIQCNIRDITARRLAEEQLHALHREMEDRVEARTAQLARANQALEREIVERERSEAREHKVVVEERTRIAREIHDTLAQGLTGIVIQLEAADDVLVDQPEQARFHVLQAKTLARQSLAEARRSVWALRPLALGADDLGYAFLHLVGKLAKDSGTSIGFTLRGALRPLSDDIEHHLLRIGQEALTNALKHADADEIRVTLTCEDNGIELSVEDTGEGFELDSLIHQRGLGLRGMRERAASLGGTLKITSAPGQGTRVHVAAPLDPVEGATHGEEKPDQDSRR